MMWRTYAVLAALVAAGCAGRDDAGSTTAADSAALFLEPLPPIFEPTTPAHFSFAGLSVPNSFDSLVRRYPTSPNRNYTIYPEGSEVHDRVTSVAYAEDMAGWRRVSISFERDPGLVRTGPASGRYPRCDQILQRITTRYGAEDSLKQFADDTHVRADRYWNHPGELMILLCILDRNVHYARALTLERFPQ